MKLTNFGKKTFAWLAIILIATALIVGAVLMLTGIWQPSFSEVKKAFNVIYMAVCLPVGIAGALKLKDFI